MCIRDSRRTADDSAEQSQKRYALSILVLAHTPKRSLDCPITSNDLAGSKRLYNFFGDLGPPLTFVRHIVNPVQVSVSSVVLVLREFDDIDVIVKRNASHVIRIFDNDDLL